MAGAVHSESYATLLRGLVSLRKAAELSQAQLAQKLGKPPSFVAKYELGERRLDIVETWVILRCIGAEPAETLTALLQDCPISLE